MMAIFNFKSKRCMGCLACIAACRQERDLPPYHDIEINPDACYPSPIRISESSKKGKDGRDIKSFNVKVCINCKDAECIKVCKPYALYEDSKTKAVNVDLDLCTGCGACKNACPFDVPEFYNGKLVKCDLCINRVNQEKKTACEQVCPARAIQVDLNGPEN